MRRAAALQLGFVATALLFGGAACQKRIDRFVVRRVADRALAVPDLGKACALGSSFSHAAVSVSSEERPPHRAMVIVELCAALCGELEAWEEETAAARVLHNLLPLGESRAAEVTDARLRAERVHFEAATRFHRAFSHLEPLYGPVGDGCPKLGRDDELPYLVGLVAGVLALLHDRAGGSLAGVPVETLGRVGRGASCLRDEVWWHVPLALQASAWAILPGTAPEGVDPWVALEEAARSGETSGVRVSRALSVLIAGNGGRTEFVEKGIRAHAASLKSTEQDPQWALLDEYARTVTLHQSDLIWTAATGHRTPVFGELPADAVPEAPPPDPFDSP